MTGSRVSGMLGTLKPRTNQMLCRQISKPLVLVPFSPIRLNILQLTYSSRGALMSRLPSLAKRIVVPRMRSFMFSCDKSCWSEAEKDRTSWPCSTEWSTGVGADERLSFLSLEIRGLTISSNLRGRGEAARFPETFICKMERVPRTVDGEE